MPVIDLVIASGARLNSAEAGAGLPVQLRIYQLSSESALAVARFEDLWKMDADVLGDALLERRELTVYPDSVQNLEWEARPAARSIAAVAIFREPVGRDWTMSVSLPAPRQTPDCPEERPRLSLWLDGMKIRDGAGRADPE
jgi:type VI secretion system VasD/TssJ family lipoprotein